jgi:High potential iron-sulfur protein
VADISCILRFMFKLISRREALRTLTGAAGVAVLPRHAFAAERLDVKAPAAVATGYVEDASQVDAKKYSNYVRGSSCANCLQLQGAPGAAYRPCDFFQGKLVAAAGWCSAWTAEM